MPLLNIPQRLIDQSRLYAVASDDAKAVCYILDAYPGIVAEVRELRRRCSELDNEGSELDARLAQLQALCQKILDL